MEAPKRPSVAVYYVPKNLAPVPPAKPHPPPAPEIQVAPAVVPPPPPAQEPIESRLFRAGQDAAIEIAGWNKGPDDILPVNIDEIKDAQQREETYDELARREALIQADHLFQFVELVAGLTGEKTDASSYWDGVAQGREAVEAAFSNLFKEQRDQGLSIDAKTQEKIAQNMIQNLFRDGKDDRALDIERLQALRGIPGLPNDGRQLAELIEYAKEIKQLKEALGITSSSVLPTPAYKAAAAAGALGATLDDPDRPIRQYLAQRDIGFQNAVRTFDNSRQDPDVARIVFNQDPNRWRATYSALVAADAAASSSAASTTTAATSATTTPSTNATPGTASFSLKVDGQYYDHMENGKLVLARLMLSKNFSAMQWRAWDVLYNGGRYTDSELRKGGRGTGGDPNDPVYLEKSLRARREILRMFNANKASIAWRRAPENLGKVFLKPSFKVALEKSLGDVRNVSKRQNVVDTDLMTHPEVRVYFAYLVAFNIAEARAMFAPTRVIVSGRQFSLTDSKQALLRMFSTLEYHGRELAFAGITDPLQVDLRRALEATRQREFQRTGGQYYSPGSMSNISTPTSAKPFKKARVEIDPRIEARELARVNMLVKGKK